MKTIGKGFKEPKTKAVTKEVLQPKKKLGAKKKPEVVLLPSFTITFSDGSKRTWKGYEKDTVSKMINKFIIKM